MKKIFISLFIVLLFVFNAYSYTATDKDTILINKISNKIEEVIESKGEKYRNIFIERLEKIKSKTNKERLIFIIDQIISEINNVEDELGGLFDNLDEEDLFTKKQECSKLFEQGKKEIKELSISNISVKSINTIFYSPSEKTCVIGYTNTWITDSWEGDKIEFGIYDYFTKEYIITGLNSSKYDFYIKELKK